MANLPQNEGAVGSLPFHVVDSIIDEAIQTLDPQTISSIALLSRNFRLSANTARFSSLVFDTKGSFFEREIARIRRLANLIESGNQMETLNGINTCITSFTLKLKAPSDQHMAMFLNDGSLALIFRNLFRQLPESASARRRLAMECAINQGRMVDFRYFDKDLSKEFLNLIEASYLNDISLVMLAKVPPNLLQRSRIQHLHLAKVLTNTDAGESQLDSLVSPPVQLKTLSLEPLFTRYEAVLRLLCPRSLPTPDTFSKITSVNFQIYRMEGRDEIQKILSQTSCLESFTIQANGSLPAMRPPTFTPLLYEGLRRLKFLRIDITNLENGPFTYFACYLGQSAPPSLEVIRLNLRQQFPIYNDTFSELGRLWFYRLEQLAEARILDEQLARSFYHGVAAVEIHITTTIYQKRLQEFVSLAECDETFWSQQREFEARLANSFPKCREAHPSLELRISVSFSDGE